MSGRHQLMPTHPVRIWTAITLGPWARTWSRRSGTVSPRASSERRW